MIKILFFLLPLAMAQLTKPTTTTTTSSSSRTLPKIPFAVVTSGIIRPNTTFLASIRRFAPFSGSLTVKMTLSGKTDSGSSYSSQRSVTLSSNTKSAVTSFHALALEKGSHSITVEADGFAATRELVYALRNTALVLQIEKPIYSPGQLVRFRIFAMDPATNAVNPSDDCSAKIQNSNGILVERYEYLEFTKGKYEGELLLGDKACLGVWSLEVTCGLQHNYETFEVAEYTLPPFSVSLSVPPTIAYSAGKVPIAISASYPTGDPVDGNATLQVNRWGESILTRTIILKSGVSTFDLSLANDLKATTASYWSYDCSLRVVDAIFGTNITADGFFQINPHLYQIELTGKQFFTPGSAYSYSIKVKSENGAPPPLKTKVNIIINSYINQTITLNNAGFASASYAVPKNSTYLNIMANAPDCSTGYLYLYLQTGTPGYISLYPNVQNGNNMIKLNQLIEIKAVVAETVDQINYYVSSKGVLLEASAVPIKIGSKSVSFFVKADIRCFPYCTITAMYLKGVDIITGSTQIYIREGLNNHVKLSFDNVEVGPGADHSFIVNSKCDSTVSFAAIDQRGLQLKPGKTIQFNDIINSMYQFEYDNLRPRRNLPSYESLFYWNAKLLFFTNIPPPPMPSFDYPSAEPFPSEDSQIDPGFSPNSNRPAYYNSGNTVKVRKDFRETLLWEEVVTNTPVYSKTDPNNCQGKITTKVPESITKYVVYSISMNSKQGIGLAMPSNITIKSIFSLAWTPPFSVLRNEVMLMDIGVFNSLTQDQKVIFMISKMDCFEAVDLESYGWKESDTTYEKSELVKASKPFKIQFAVRFNSAGTHFIKITAKGPLAGDGIEKPVRVNFEGIPRTITRSVMTLGFNPSETDLQCEYPSGVYEDSKSVMTTVIGDIIGKALANLENLITMPSGCGEQNLLSLMPDLAIHRYLQAVEKLTSELDSKLKQYEKVGVQNQLNYLRFDGSFSAFGNSDPSGSVWLTLYTVLAFYWAKAFVTVDEMVIVNALSWVISNQQPDGSFVEPGRVIHVDLQGGSGGGLALNAYSSMVLSILLNDYPQYTDARDNVNSYLMSAWMNTNKPYDLAIISHAFLLAGCPDAQSVFNTFFDMRIENPTELHWEQSTAPSNGYMASSLNVEATSYGLMNLVFLEESENAIKAAKYLIGQTNQNGGFGSSQDTVIALTALASFASSFVMNGATVSLTLTPNTDQSPISAQIDPSNSMTLQQFELDSRTTILNVKVSDESTGIAIVQLICNFYQDPSAVIPSFKVSYQYYRQCKHALGLKVCASYIPEGTSNMAIITVNLPSGFQFQQWWGNNNPNVSKIETFNSGAKVVFYLNTIGKDQTCVDVNAYKAQTVIDLKGGTIMVNDYYDTSLEGSAKYPAPDLSGVCNWGVQQATRG